MMTLSNKFLQWFSFAMLIVAVYGSIMIYSSGGKFFDVGNAVSTLRDEIKTINKITSANQSNILSSLESVKLVAAENQTIVLSNQKIFTTQESNRILMMQQVSKVLERIAKNTIDMQAFNSEQYNKINARLDAIERAINCQ